MHLVPHRSRFSIPCSPTIWHQRLCGEMNTFSAFRSYSLIEFVLYARNTNSHWPLSHPIQDIQRSANRLRSFVKSFSFFSKVCPVHRFLKLPHELVSETGLRNRNSWQKLCTMSGSCVYCALVWSESPLLAISYRRSTKSIRQGEAFSAIKSKCTNSLFVGACRIAKIC